MIVLDSISDEQLGSILGSGGVAVLPTDTVYGLAASVANQAAVTRLYKIKKREGKPGTLIAADVEQLVALGLDKVQLTKVEHLWPGPVSVVLPVGEALEYIHAGLNSLAVRIPADSQLRQLLRNTGILLTSSANISGYQPAENEQQAIAYFGEDVDAYVRGSTAGRQSSTVVRLEPDGSVHVLRQGAR